MALHRGSPDPISASVRAAVGALAIVIAASSALAHADATETSTGLGSPRPDASRTPPAPAATPEVPGPERDAYDDEIPPPPSAVAPPSSPAAVTPLAPIDPVDDETRIRLRLIEEHMLILSTRGNSAILDGITSTLTGALFIGLGVYANNRTDDPAVTRIAKYWYFSGATSIASAIIAFSLSPRVSHTYNEFSELPTSTPAERREALARGESLFHRIAKRTRASRMTSASLSIVTGAVSIPILLGGDGFSTDDPYDYLLAITGAITIITGITNLATRSEAERRWQAYVRYRDSHAVPRTPRIAFDGVSGAVVPGGGGATLRLRF